MFLWIKYFKIYIFVVERTAISVSEYKRQNDLQRTICALLHLNDTLYVTFIAVTIITEGQVLNHHIHSNFVNIASPCQLLILLQCKFHNMFKSILSASCSSDTRLVGCSSLAAHSSHTHTSRDTLCPSQLLIVSMPT